MGSFASKGAREAGPSIRKYPTRAPNLKTRPPVSRAPTQSHVSRPGPTARPPRQSSGSKAEVIDLDAAFVSRLNELGPVQPNPHFSPTSTSQFDPQRNVSSEFPSDMMTSPPRSPFPDPGNNPAVRLLQARQRIQEEAEEELGAVGRKAFQGRKYIDAGLIQLALMRQQRGEPQKRIEEALGIKRGRLNVLRKGIVEVAHD